jgi:hypothetical protein
LAAGTRGQAVSARPEHLPPLDALPPDVTVPVLPGLGLTWYDRRGAGYWARRAGMSVLWAFLTALVTLITAAILTAFYHRSAAAFTAVLALETAYSLAILAYFAAAAARTLNDPQPGPIRARSWPGQVFFGFSALSIGLYLALLLTSLLPEPPAERRAWLGVAAELRRRGHALPWT